MCVEGDVGNFEFEFGELFLDFFWVFEEVFCAGFVFFFWVWFVEDVEVFVSQTCTSKAAVAVSKVV